MHRAHVFLLALLTACAMALPSSPSRAATPQLRILASTFPIYQITRNVTRDVEGIALELMIPAALGCPHDYVLTPQDMDKLAKADLLIINGLGMEEFLGSP
jgi:ABC-type Zn uptake system ZnuABC Zn-binding protein ZnuA